MIDIEIQSCWKVGFDASICEIDLDGTMDLEDTRRC